MASSKPRRIYCFICGNVKENDQKVALFSVPKNSLEEWRAAIGNNSLKVASKLCDVHFNRQAIIKGQVIGGSFFPYLNIWKLEKDALPTLLLGNYSESFPISSLIILIPIFVLGKSSSLSRQPLKDISSNKENQGLGNANIRTSAQFRPTNNYNGMVMYTKAVLRIIVKLTFL